jgi:hypothetical protein
MEGSSRLGWKQSVRNVTAWPGLPAGLHATPPGGLFGRDKTFKAWLWPAGAAGGACGGRGCPSLPATDGPPCTARQPGSV